MKQQFAKIQCPNQIEKALVNGIFLKKYKKGNFYQKQLGVSLIEMLVVVAVIAVLSIALFAYFKVNISRSRDAQRKDDLKGLKIALEDYYNDHGTYPPEEVFTHCGGSDLQPYLKEIPCDPISGAAYLYLPIPGNGDNSKGYRILSRLDDLSDPIISTLGCTGGCGGVPSDNPYYSESSNFVYGISEGAAVASGDKYVAPTAVPTAAPTTKVADDSLIQDAAYCETHTCYCCSSTVSSSQDCNIWNTNDICSMGPYATVNDCYQETPCRPNQ